MKLLKRNHQVHIYWLNFEVSLMQDGDHIKSIFANAKTTLTEQITAKEVKYSWD